MRISKNDIARRLMLTVVGCGLLVVVAGTSIQLYLEYKSDMRQISRQLDNVQTTYVDALAKAVWLLDDATTRMILRGISQLPFVLRAEVDEKTGRKYAAGRHAAGSAASFEVPLTYAISDDRVVLGTLKVFDDRQALLRRIVEQSSYIAITTVLLITVVAFLISTQVHRLVTRDLVQISRYARALQHDVLDVPLELKHRRGRGPADEILQLVDAINATREDLRRSLDINKAHTHELERRENLLKAIIDNLPVGLLVKDKEHLIEIANQTYLDWYGLAADDLLGREGRPDGAAQTEADAAEKLSHERQALKAGKVVSRLTERTFADGRERILRVTKFPIFDQSGDINLVGSVTIDLTEQIEARQRLQESEAMLSAIADNVPIFLNLKDREGRYVFVNRHLAALDQLPDGGHIGKRLIDVYPRHRVSKFAAADKDVLTAGVTIEFEAVHPADDSDERTIHVIKFPIRGEQGEVRFVGTAAIEITDWVAAEAALRASEARLRAITEAVPILLNLKDDEGRYQFVNQRQAQHFGVEPEKLIGTKPTTWLPAPRSEFFVQQDLVVLRTGRQIEFEIEAAPDTEEIFHVIKFPVRDENGRVSGVGTACLDVTERRKAENALKAREAWFRGLFENAPVGIAIKDTEGRYVEFNRRYLEWVDWDLEDAVGKTAHDFFPPAVAERGESEDRIVMHDKVSTVIDMTVPDTDGNDRVLSGTKAPLLSATGEVVGVSLYYLDITEARQIEMQLQQAQKMDAIGRLAGGIAHDFNNLLAAILGYNEFLIEDLEPDSVQRDFAFRIDLAGQRAKQLVSQILAFSRGSTSEFQPLDIALVVDEVVALLEGSLPPTTSIIRHSDMRPAMVVGNAGQLSQVMMNLGVNASDALQGREGTVRLGLDEIDAVGNGWQDTRRRERVEDSLSVSTLDDGGTQVSIGQLDPALSYIRLTVDDNGTGIPRAVVSKMFDPFFTTKDVDKGTGLGLSVVRGIILSHGGTVRLKTRVGVGTKFEICLPQSLGGAAPVDELTSRTAPAGQGLVLIVDDEKDVADMMATGLDRLGYETVVCNSGREALEIFDEASAEWNAVVTDHAMPDMQGMDLIRHIKRRTPDLTCILYTGFSDTLTQEKAMSEGADAYFVKPVPIWRLARSLAQFLDPE